MFALQSILYKTVKNIGNMPEYTFENIMAKYFEINIAHLFIEGNSINAYMV